MSNAENRIQAEARRQREEAQKKKEKASADREKREADREEARQLGRTLKETSAELSEHLKSIKTAVSDSERERNQWQQHGPPGASLSSIWRAATISAIISGVTSAVLTALIFFLFLATPTATPSAPGADQSADAGQAARAIENFTDSERRVWDRDCATISDSQRTTSETWQNQCVQMLTNASQR